MLNLSIEKRDQLKKKAKNLYSKNCIPGVLYGPGIEPIPISITTHDFEKVYREAGESMLISVDMKDEERKEIVLIRNPQRDVVSRNFIHTDLYQLPLNKPVEVTVSIESIGESIAVKENRGVLLKNIQEIVIKTLPKSLIHEIKVDISVLKTFDDVITIKDLNLPENIETMFSEDSVVFSVQQPKTQEEIEQEEQAEAIEDSTIDTEEPQEDTEEPNEEKTTEEPNEEK